MKNYYATVAMAALGMAAISSCNEYLELEPVLSTDAVLENKIAEFDQAFVTRFGDPKEGHMWGTDKELESIMVYGKSSPTRGGDGNGPGNVDVSRNLWCYRQEGEYYKGNGHFLQDVVKVPGWPNFDGYYYTSMGNGIFENKNVVGENTVMSNSSYQPIGDVTEFEIQYVSTWFRTHPNPEKINLHLTDFFIQNVSQDNDQLAYDHSTTDPGMPSYFMTTMAGKSVFDVTKSHNGENANKVNDVLQQGTQTDKKNNSYVPKISRFQGHENSNEELNYRVDYLGFKSVAGDWTHVNNFNRGNSNFNPEDNNGNNFREIKYVTSSGTEDFTCRPSMGVGQDPTIDSWVLVKLEWDEPAYDFDPANPNPDKILHREGYYLAFDFHTLTNDTKIECDGYYSNWIVKITPGYFVPGDYAARVMCEDLGGSFDFDFNDVVFDIAHDGTNNELIISLQAAGGTLPLIVGMEHTSENLENYEAHYLFGQDVKQPVNVDATPDATAPVAIYRIPWTSSVSSKKAYYDIPIYVQQNGTWTNVNTNLPTLTVDEYGKPYTSSASKTPRKFVTEIGVRWMKELKSIDAGYSKFKEWVQLEDFHYDVTDPSATDRPLQWYSEITGEELIHVIPANINGAVSDPTTKLESWWRLQTISNTCPLNNCAIDVVTIAKYNGETGNSIIDAFKDKAQDKQQITFATFLKSKTQTVHAFMVPVWIHNDGKAYFHSSKDTYTEITKTILSNSNSYDETYPQANFFHYYNGTTLTDYGYDVKTGKDGEGNYTSVSKYAFKRTEIAYMDGETEVFCDYLMIFVEENLDSDGDPLATKPVKQHELYCIF